MSIVKFVVIVTIASLSTSDGQKYRGPNRLGGGGGGTRGSGGGGRLSKIPGGRSQRGGWNHEASSDYSSSIAASSSPSYSEGGGSMNPRGFRAGGPDNQRNGNGEAGPRLNGFAFDMNEHWTSITCPDDHGGSTTTTEIPDCQPQPPGHGGHHFAYSAPQKDGAAVAGTWVCRSLYDPVTGLSQKQRTVCIDSVHGALSTDQCGCCEPDRCPKVCECPCNEDGEDGVLVDVSSKRFIGGGETVVTRCHSSAVAVSMVAGSDSVTCNKSCNL
ncbi:hypothetical protein ACA910_009514 [Epithemia clementina (nom. ined.)]